MSFVKSPNFRKIPEKYCAVWKIMHPAVLYFALFGIIPMCLLITVIAYARIYCNIRRIIKVDRTQRAPSDASCNYEFQQRQSTRELKTTIIIMATVIFFLIGWVPGIVSFCIFIATKGNDTARPFLNVSFMMYSINSMLNPLFYATHIRWIKKRMDRFWNFFLLSTESEITTE